MALSSSSLTPSGLRGEVEINRGARQQPHHRLDSCLADTAAVLSLSCEPQGSAEVALVHSMTPRRPSRPGSYVWGSGSGGLGGFDRCLRDASSSRA